MRNTVVILNEELCSMSLAFKNAGFNIVAAFEKDKKACDIFSMNLRETLIYGDMLETDIFSIPNADVMVAKLEIHDWEKISDNKSMRHRAEAIAFYEIVRQKIPKCLLIEMNKKALKLEAFHQLMAQLSGIGYKIECSIFDVNKTTGMPVTEHKLYIVGLRDDIENEFNFLDDFYHPPYYAKDIYEYKSTDSWYYQIREDQIYAIHSHDFGEPSFWCWKEDGYAQTEKITWNTVKVPLVSAENNIRKITHREIARLKGYPEEFLLDVKNKAWLYKKLMYASNVRLVFLIAKSLEYVLKDKTILNQQRTRGLKFEELFGRYLEKKISFHKGDIKAHDDIFNLTIDSNEEKIHFKVKMYTNKTVNGGSVLRICDNMKSACFTEADKMILVVGNVVEETIKKQAEEKYGVKIWDVANILFLFDEYSEVKSEFIALLNYTVNDITPKCPDPNLLKYDSENISQGDLARKLENVKPGNENFSIYEKVCVEILVKVFGEYLTLWKEQQKSNDGLYRFDLCCKIKADADHEFFDTVKYFFNTKYIVFEFKNHSEPISQSEIYTTEKYLYKTALRCVAIIISRKGANENALAATRGCLRENGKLILCLSDEDLRNLLILKQNEEKPTAEVLSDMLDEMLINLEK